MTAISFVEPNIHATAAARSLTDRIKAAVEGTWELIKEAYTSRAWAALGYTSWDDYCTREFGTSRLRLPREERAEVVASLRESGLSIRAIASATNEPVMTVQNEIARGVRGRTPARPAIQIEDQGPGPTQGKREPEHGTTVPESPDSAAADGRGPAAGTRRGRYSGDRCLLSPSSGDCSTVPEFLGTLVSGWPVQFRTGVGDTPFRFCGWTGGILRQTLLRSMLADT